MARPPARRSPWAWIRVSEPASRLHWWMSPVKSLPPMLFIRIPLKMPGKRRLASWPRWRKNIGVALISIGNGTGSRETDRLVQELIKRRPDLNLQKITVSEAGASVYSASALAAQELPGMDVSLRGAVSIARRLQDPLSELVILSPRRLVSASISMT